MRISGCPKQPMASGTGQAGMLLANTPMPGGRNMRRSGRQSIRPATPLTGQRWIACCSSPSIKIRDFSSRSSPFPRRPCRLGFSPQAFRKSHAPPTLTDTIWILILKSTLKKWCRRLANICARTFRLIWRISFLSFAWIPAPRGTKSLTKARILSPYRRSIKLAPTIGGIIGCGLSMFMTRHSSTARDLKFRCSFRISRRLPIRSSRTG